MEDQTSLTGTFFEKTEHYIKTSAELFKLKALDKSTDVISDLTARLVVIAFIALSFFILTIGVSLWIGEELGKSYYGFFIIAGFYGLIGILLYVFRNVWIKEPLKNSIIEQVLN